MVAAFNWVVLLKGLFVEFIWVVVRDVFNWFGLKLVFGWFRTLFSKVWKSLFSVVGKPICAVGELEDVQCGRVKFRLFAS